MPIQFKTLTEAVITGEPGNVLLMVVNPVKALKSR